MKIPDFLTEMSKQLNMQSNRCTADPVWQVRCKRTRITSEDQTDRFQLIDHDEGYLAADSHIEQEFNEQIVEHLDCDPDDLPVIFENWVNSEEVGGLTGQEKIDYFIENFDCEVDDLEGFRLIWVEEYEDIIMGAFLTEQDANWFINRKQHDYPKLYTYVTSMYFSVQMKELRNWIMSLTKEDIS